MTSDAFVEFARKLFVLPLGACPAGSRSIVSRLYYGVFHSTRKFIEDQLGFPHQSFDSNNKHQWVQIYLYESNHPNSESLGGLFGNAA